MIAASESQMRNCASGNLLAFNLDEIPVFAKPAVAGDGESRNDGVLWIPE